MCTAPFARHRTAVFALLLVLAKAPLITANDGLQFLSQEVQSQGPFDPPQPKPKEEKPPSYQSNSFYEDDDNEVESALGSFLVLGAVFTASTPFWGPAVLVGDDYASAAFFPRYPYQEPIDGYLMIEPNLPRKPRNWAGRLQLETAGDFGDLTAWNGALLLETTSRLGIDTRAHYYTEKNAGGALDVWLGDANVTFRFAQSTRLAMRAGVGVNWLDDELNRDYGFNFTYGGDWYPWNPFVISAELDWGEIGHASLFQTRLTAGVQWHRAEIYAGHEYLDVGNSQFSTVIAGFRLWF